MAFTTSDKKKLIEKFKLHESDTGSPEVQVGLIPGGGATQRLPRMIGLEKALKLLTQGNHINPPEALELGIIDLIVEPGKEVDAPKNWILESGDAEQPWDKKGFRFPGGAGLMHPGAIQTQMFGITSVGITARSPLKIFLSCCLCGSQRLRKMTGGFPTKN